MKKNISIIKRSSLVIMVISFIIAAIYVDIGIFELRDKVYGTMGPYYKAMRISCFIDAAIFVVAALMCCRIFRSGRPFTRGNVWMVRGIAGFFLMKMVIRVIIEGSSEGFFRVFVSRGADSVFLAGIFLFVAEILRYGKLLELESDETL
jgi:hypothetical protein